MAKLGEFCVLHFNDDVLRFERHILAVQVNWTIIPPRLLGL